MRRKRRNTVNVQSKNREELESLYGQVWTVQTVAREFVINAIIGNMVVVRRKADDAVGTLEYQEGPPQFYFRFTPQPGEQ